MDVSQLEVSYMHKNPTHGQNRLSCGKTHSELSIFLYCGRHLSLFAKAVSEERRSTNLVQFSLL